MYGWAKKIRHALPAIGSEKLSFVLTLALGGTGRSGNELERAAILLDSVVRHVPREEISRFFIVTRPGDLGVVQSRFGPYVERCRLIFIDENSLFPALRHDPPTPNLWPHPGLGWHRQQILKLMAHQIVDTPFYMTLDSDVIFTKPFRTNNFVTDRRSLINTETDSDYARLYGSDFGATEAKVKQCRYTDAEHLLTLKRTNSSLWYGETPVILSRVLVHNLLTHLEETWGRPWSQVLLDNLAWTEYALYFTYAEASGRLDKFHRAGDCDTVMNFSQSLWWGPDHYRDHRTLDSWPVNEVFASTAPGCCVVVQSYVGYDPAHVRMRVEPFIGHVLSSTQPFDGRRPPGCSGPRPT